MHKYIRIMRLNHWIKNLFVLPGSAFALLLVPEATAQGYGSLFWNLFFGLLSTCLIASANYVINEWLDAPFDRFHPVKKHRAVVEEGVDGCIVYALYAALTLIGFALGLLVSLPVFLMELWLWVMGILYNVKPFRTKDLPFVDVLTESINNAIRLLIGWFIITSVWYPPLSIIIGYWLGGAFLMDIKRFSEYRMIADKTTASLYRKSFAYYDERILLGAAFFYAMASSFFVGIFLIKYRIEFIVLMPFLMGLFCYYLMISYKKDSAAQAPEKLYREKGLMLYVLFLSVLFVVLLKFDIPALACFVSDRLIHIG